MQAYMETNPSIGMLGPQMLCPDGQIGRSYMRFPTLWRGLCDAFALRLVFRNSGGLSGIMMTDFDNSQTAEVDVLNGWFVMVRRIALEEVGGLDGQFFMYGEDIDWSYRFNKAGWKRVYFSEARASHYGGASSAVAPTRFYLEMKRANLSLIRKHYGEVGAVLYVSVTLLHELLRALGNCILITFNRERPKAILNMKRSLACLRWMATRSLQGAEKVTLS
jgi:GT2 family glycosyltransferase